MEVKAAAAEGRTPAATGGGGMGGGSRTEPEGLPCPRCESTNTKFCYYNNYNLSQPRHFCKACRRYWTRGGALRNVPVGGGTRTKSVHVSTPAARRKRAAASTAAPAPAVTTAAALPLLPPPLAYELPPFLPMMGMEPDRRLLDLGGSFTSLLAAAAPPPAMSASSHFATGFLLGTVASPAFSPSPSPSPSPTPSSAPPPVSSSQPAPESIWAMGWPHLSI